MHARALVWFRRDLRDHDHAALAAALDDAREVYAAFVFDREILDALPTRVDRRVEFIRESLVELDATLRARGGALIVVHDRAREAIPALAARLCVDAVYANRDYEPAAIARDDEVERRLADAGIAWRSFRDQVIFERDEIVTAAGTSFTVFTPYKRAWLAALTVDRLAPIVPGGAGRLAAPPAGTVAAGVPALEAIGFSPSGLGAIGVVPGMRGARQRLDDFLDRIDRYHETRDFPGVKGVSYLSVHLRFGTVSVRTLAREAHARSLAPDGAGAATWLSELIWREFYAQVLWHRPEVVEHAFRPSLDRLAFPNDPSSIAAWREARTGYPIVDAAMRQLHATGFMHNRLRMIAASFLVKDLLVDWRIGERHFADTLLDYELASNNGGWQWAASTGCDAQPWFRIFNPVLQSQRFDPDGRFLRRYLPELARLPDDAIHAPWLASPQVLADAGIALGRDYPRPVVDHAIAREQALALFRSAA